MSSVEHRGCEIGGAGQVQPDEHDPLQTDLAVLDFADILEFGGQARYAAGAGARLALQEAIIIGLALDVPTGGGGQSGSGTREDPGDNVLGGRGGTIIPVNSVSTGIRIVGACRRSGIRGTGFVHSMSFSYATARSGAQRACPDASGPGWGDFVGSR